MTQPDRKGASRVADVEPAILRQLNEGTLPSATLAEILATDMRILLATVFPDLSNEASNIDPKQGITKKMSAAAKVVYAAHGTDKSDMMASHGSDIVRGWAAYIVGLVPNLALPERLELIRPFADDPHFGVREWAWLALRPQIVSEPGTAIEVLTVWARDTSANIRRFAVESVRPRGVWATHISELKTNPGLARPLLELVKADPERYVQDSVANWLNDAWKTAPDWVEALCVDWGQTSSDNTAYIIKRALRSRT